MDEPAPMQQLLEALLYFLRRTFRRQPTFYRSPRYSPSVLEIQKLSDGPSWPAQMDISMSWTYAKNLERRRLRRQHSSCDHPSISDAKLADSLPFQTRLLPDSDNVSLASYAVSEGSTLVGSEWSLALGPKESKGLASGKDGQD